MAGLNDIILIQEERLNLQGGFTRQSSLNLLPKQKRPRSLPAGQHWYKFCTPHPTSIFFFSSLCLYVVHPNAGHDPLLTVHYSLA